MRPTGGLASPTAPAGRNALRVVHLTDMHVQPERRAGEGYAMALASLAGLDPQPAFIVTGGDHVMDVMGSTRERADVQWALYQKVLDAGTKLKVYPVVGNHDIFGWSTDPAIDPSAELYGKAMALHGLRIPKDYYSFDHGNWHFIILNNVQQRDRGYYGDLDPEQSAWLTADLAANAGKKPACVFSHIPIASIAALLSSEAPKEFWRVSDALLHRNCRALIRRLAEGNAKLCVSGHIHLMDQLKFMGVNFVSNGAVSGSWWKGPHQFVPEGYGIFDLYDDGTYDYQYLTYGWKAERE
jgi:3',5'-cyclic AMP phosphodiesterase CpdA